MIYSKRGYLLIGGIAFAGINFALESAGISKKCISKGVILMKNKIWILTVIILIASLECAFGATHYVRQGAAGNGSGVDWLIAYTNLPQVLVRGDTYYLADGTYNNSYDFNDAEAGSVYIYIRKAIDTDHGTDTGWNRSYGDGQALFTGGVSFLSSYWDINGQVGNGKGNSQPYGIKIKSPTPSGKGVQISSSNYIRLSYVEIQGNGPDGAGSPADDGIYIATASHYNLFSHMYLHFFGRVPFLYRSVTDTIIEYCYVDTNESTPEQHAEGISASAACANNTIRHTVWEKIEGTGVIVFRGDGWKIYGNMIFDSLSSNGSITTWSAKSGLPDVTNAKVYNNTIVDSTGYNQGISFAQTGSSPYGNLIYNNLFYGNSKVRNNGGTTIANIILSDSSLFENYSANDFRLADGTSNGKDGLPAPYNIDMTGTIRGQDGVWDVGAYEYNSGQTAALNAPKNLRRID